MSTSTTSSVPYLSTAVAELTAEHPDREWRLGKAANIVAVRTIERSPSGPGWWVESESEAGKFYFVLAVGGRDTCSCQDYQRRGGPCKHSLAVGLLSRATAERHRRQRALDFGERWELTEAGTAALAALA